MPDGNVAAQQDPTVSTQAVCAGETVTFRAIRDLSEPASGEEVKWRIMYGRKVLARGVGETFSFISGKKLAGKTIRAVARCGETRSEDSYSLEVVLAEIKGYDHYIPLDGDDGAHYCMVMPQGGKIKWSEPTGRLQLLSPNSSETVSHALGLGDMTVVLRYEYKGVICKDEWRVGLWKYKILPPGDASSDPDPLSPEMRGALYKSASTGDAEKLAEMFNTAPSRIQAKLQLGRTPLHAAAMAGRKVTVELLIDRGADLSATDEYGFTPLLLASLARHKEVVDLLIARGADVDIFTAAALGDAKRAASLLKDAPGIVNARNRYHTTPLHIAAEMGHTEIVELFATHKASVDAEDSKGSTPLEMAARRGHVEIAKALLANGAEIDKQGQFDRTPLHLAARHGKRWMVELLLQNGADINARDDSNWTPIKHAILLGEAEVTKLLLAEGAYINVRRIDRMNVRFAVPRAKRSAIRNLLKKHGLML